MGKTSAKKRRQREWRRREHDRLRGMSLAGVSKPYLKLDRSPEPTHDGLNNRTTVSFPTSKLTSSPQLPHQSQDELETSEASPVSSDVVAPLNDPKVVTWKRVEFVLPRALGRNGFVFARQVKIPEPTKEHPIGHSQNDSRSQNQDHLDNNETQKESIDDILFPGRRQRKPEDIAGEKSNDGHRHPHQHENPQHDVFSASRRQKLEVAFERVHRDSVDEIVDPSNFVDIPRPHIFKAQPQGSANVTGFSSNKTLLELSIPPGNQEIVNGQTHRHRSVDDNFSRTSDVPPDNLKVISSDSKQSHRSSHTPFRGEVSGRSVEEVVRDKMGLRPRANSTDGELNLPQGGLCDERMVLEAYKWNHAAPCSPKGFRNLGNTCFLNATLQCLAHVPPFCQTLITISDSKTKNWLNGKINKGQKITFALCSLFRQAHGLGSRMSVGGAIAPSKIVGALPTIGSCGSRNGYKFRPGRQEDAHEFLVHLLDTMNDGELRAAGINQHASGWRDRLPVSRLDETTFIHRIFGGYFRSQVKCQKCNYRSNTYDPFLDLSLEVSKKSSNSVLEALAQFTRKETLDTDNQWKCSGCKKYVCPTKQLTVFRPPLVLCIQLKRFAFSNSFGFGRNGLSRIYGGGSKISKPIDFPANLDLPLSDKRSCAYALTGIVVHVGGSASSGHYTACVKRPGNNGSTQWYHLDDSFVEPVSEKTVLKQRDAYLLFYCRKEVKIEYPTPPPRSMSAGEAAEFGRIRARARADSLSKEEKQLPDHASRPTSETKLSSMPMKNCRKAQKSDSHPLANHTRTNSRNNSGYDRLSVHNQSSLEANGDGKLGEIERSSDGDSEALMAKSPDPESSASCPLAIEDSGHGSKKLESRNRLQAISKTDPSQSTYPSTIDSSNDRSNTEDDSCDSSNGMKKNVSSIEEGYFGEPKNGTLSARDVKTRVVVDTSDSRGKVKVMLGPRKKKLWESKARTVPSREKNFQLLGNLGVQRWDDDDLGAKIAAPQISTSSSSVQKEREKVVEKIQKEDQSRKRKMHLDRWDAYLDQGRQKKLKSGTRASSVHGSNDSKRNQFQLLQDSVQRTVRGKPKGLVWQQKKDNQKLSPNNGFRL